MSSFGKNKSKKEEW